MEQRAPVWSWTTRAIRLQAGGTVLASLLLLIQSAGSQAPPSPPVALRLDVNRAPEAVLTALPGIGPGRARAIAAARQAQPIDSLVDLELRVRGLGPRTANAIRPFLRFPNEQPRPQEGQAPQVSPPLARPLPHA